MLLVFIVIIVVVVIVVAAVVAAFLTYWAVTVIIEGFLIFLFLIELEGLNKIFSRVFIIISLNRIIILPLLILNIIIKI